MSRHPFYVQRLWHTIEPSEFLRQSRHIVFLPLENPSARAVEAVRNILTADGSSTVGVYVGAQMRLYCPTALMHTLKRAPND